HIVGRAIDRIDDPEALGRLPAPLLAEETVAREGPRELAHDERLGRLVGRAHRVLRALPFDRERGAVLQVPARQPSGGARHGAGGEEAVVVHQASVRFGEAGATHSMPSPESTHLRVAPPATTARACTMRLKIAGDTRGFG